MKITLFEPQCRVDTLISNNKILEYKVISILVEGFKNTAAHEDKLDSFVCSMRDSTWDNYVDCLVPIYMKSKHINNENIKNNPQDYYDYPQESNYIYEYRWSKATGFIKTPGKGNLYFDGIVCKKK